MFLHRMQVQAVVVLFPGCRDIDGAIDDEVRQSCTMQACGRGKSCGAGADDSDVFISHGVGGL